MTTFGFTALLGQLETRLVEGLGLHPLSVPSGLADRRGIWKGEPVSLAARAYRSRAIRYARFVTVSGAELEIGNALCLAAPEYPMPILGIDLVGFSRDRCVVVADLSPVDQEGPRREAQLATLATARSGRVELPSAGALPAWCLPWFSSQALFVRPVPAQAGEVAGAVGDFATAFLAIAASTPLQEATSAEVSATQRAYCTAHRDEDKGLGMLAKLFDAEFSRNFLHEVLFPEWTPAW